MKKKLGFIVIFIGIVASITGLIIRNSFSTTIIGGADKPTYIIITGTSFFPWYFILGLGVILFITGLIILKVQKNCEKMSNKKSAYMIMTVFFTVTTLYGATAVSLSHGALNAGYAITPMVATIAFLTLYRGQDR